MIRLLLSCLLLLSASSAVAQTPHAREVRTAEGVLLPDSVITPGVANPRLTAKVLCHQTFRTRDERRVTAAMRRQVCTLYDVVPCDRHVEVDHLISLELGGANDIQNLWPQPYAPSPGARQKDVLENWLHKQVCAGMMSLEAAQQAIATNWYALYLQREAQRSRTVK